MIEISHQYACSIMTHIPIFNGSKKKLSSITQILNFIFMRICIKQFKTLANTVVPLLLVVTRFHVR